MAFSEYISKCISEFKGTYWKYYLILERDVKNVESYISFHQDNYNCFSNEFIKLYQTICSEIDVFCKRFCEYIHYKNTEKKFGIEGYIERKKDNPNINDYAEYIIKYQKKLIEKKEELAKNQDRKLAENEKTELKLTAQKLFMLESDCEFASWGNGSVAVTRGKVSVNYCNLYKDSFFHIQIKVTIRVYMSINKWSKCSKIFWSHRIIPFVFRKNFLNH
jgi:hypothetical protein